MVTHEPEVADFTDRKVVFRDGKLIKDIKVRKKKNVGYKTTPTKKKVKK